MICEEFFVLFCFVLFFTVTVAYAQKKTISEHSRSVNSVAFSPDGKILASGSDDETVKLWRVKDGGLITTLSGPSYVKSVTFSRDGKILASGSFDGGIKIWRVVDGTLIRALSGHSDLLFSVAFSPDGKTLASGSRDKTIKLWRVADGSLIKTLSGHSDLLHSVAFSPDGKTLASGSGDKTIKLWRVADGSLITTLSGHSNSVSSVAFSSDGKTLASGSFDKAIKLWRVADENQITTTLSWDSSSAVTSVAFSPDGNTLVSGESNGTLELWRVMDGSPIVKLSGHSRVVLSVAFSPDGKTLASGSNDSTVNLWDSSEVVSKEMAWSAELNNKNPQAMYLKAGQYARDGESSKAAQLYQSIIKIFPDSPFAVKADDQLNAGRRAERADSARKEKEYDPCSHLYVGKVVSLKGAFGITFDGEVRGTGDGKASVRSFHPITKEWSTDEFLCSNLR